MAIHHATRVLICGLAAWLLLAAAPAQADTIFMWTDAEGTKHFSNLPPPRDVGPVSKIETRASTLPCEGSKPTRRAYDQMIEEYQNEARQSPIDRRAFEGQPTRQQMQLDEKVRSERQRLEYQIDQLRRRAVSPTFSQGMRAGQIQALEERLRRLEEDPQRYFPTVE